MRHSQREKGKEKLTVVVTAAVVDADAGAVDASAACSGT